MRVDPLRFAETGRVLNGRYRLAEFTRLADYLVADEGEVEVEFRFGIDEAGVRTVDLWFRAEVRMQCQRCLEAMARTLEGRNRLGMVESSGEAERLPQEYDPLLIDGTEPLFLRDVVEDELLLSLPVVARHERGACPAAHLVEPEPEQERGAQEDEPEERENPFAVLADLKTDSKQEDS
ncbi:MAG TPA: YceD family protein [Gammaproteobacteria bacterium]|nr:YceD family protein [Gammaproteobacteria bacterium]